MLKKRFWQGFIEGEALYRVCFLGVGDGDWVGLTISDVFCDNMGKMNMQEQIKSKNGGEWGECHGGVAAREAFTAFGADGGGAFDVVFGRW